MYISFPGDLDGKESACNEGDPGSIPASGRFPGEGNGNPLQYSCLENPMDWTLVGCSPQGRKELDTTEQLTLSFHFLSLHYVHTIILHMYIYTHTSIQATNTILSEYLFFDDGNFSGHFWFCFYFCTLDIFQILFGELVLPSPR